MATVQPTKITAAWLRRRRACPEQVHTFAKEWPDGAEITLENLLRAATLNLNLDWFGQHILPPSLRAEYQRQATPLRAKYERQRAPLQAEFERQTARLLWSLIEQRLEITS